MANHKRTVGRNQQDGVEQLRGKAEEVRESVQDLGSAARDAAQQAAAQLRDAATQRATEYRDAAGEYFTAGRERAMDFEQSLEQRIREKPLQSVVIAAGVGMLMGIIWMRR